MIRRTPRNGASPRSKRRPTASSRSYSTASGRADSPRLVTHGSGGYACGWLYGFTHDLFCGTRKRVSASLGRRRGWPKERGATVSAGVEVLVGAGGVLAGPLVELLAGVAAGAV